jgi:hypothetical protein
MVNLMSEPPAKVRWIKPMGGFWGSGGGWPLSALPSTAQRMRDMAAQIGGTRSAAAVYIPKRITPYWDEETVPGNFAGLVWVHSLQNGEDVQDIATGDTKYSIGLRVRDSVCKDGPSLGDLMTSLYGPRSAVWDQLRHSMQARPVRIDVEPYERLGDWLTNFYSSDFRRVSARGRPTPSRVMPSGKNLLLIETFLEGEAIYFDGTRYKRDNRVRQGCLKHHGYRCAVCAIHFEEAYGEVGRGFMHVHHLKPLAAAGVQRLVDPIKDLRPVCPNCHAMLHKGADKPFAIEELKRRMQIARKSQEGGKRRV